MAILWIIQKHKDSMEILLMNSMDKKKRVGFGFDLKIWVGFEKHPKLTPQRKTPKCHQESWSLLCLSCLLHTLSNTMNIY